MDPGTVDTEDQVRLEVEGSVATITLNRPERLNALTFAMAERLVSTVEQLAHDPRARVVVVQGAGRAFCSGVDVEDHVDEQSPGAKTVEADQADIEAAARRWLRLWSAPIPVVVKAHGYCVGWGVELALHADIVVAADDCQFFFPSIRNGAGLPDSATAIYHVGPQWAKRLLLTGEKVDGRTAQRIGLVSESCPEADLDGAVRELAQRVTSLPATLVAQSKGVINHAVEAMGRAALQSYSEQANALARRDPSVAQFSEILQRDGRAAAIRWREERMREA